MSESPDFYKISQERKAARQAVLRESGESSQDLRKKIGVAGRVVSSEEAQTLISGGRLGELHPETPILDETTIGHLETLDVLDVQAADFDRRNVGHRAAYAQARAFDGTEKTEIASQEQLAPKQRLFTELDSMDAFRERLKQEEYKALRRPHPKVAEKLREGAKLEQGIRERLARIEADPDTASFAREHTLGKYRRAFEEHHFVPTESRWEYIARIQTLIEQGKPILLEGHTGTGKSELARMAAEELTGRQPEVVYCNPQTRQSDIFGKQSLKNKEGTTVTEVDFGPLVRAMQEGAVCLFDEYNELDPRQRQVLKYIYNAKPGDSVDVPGDGKVRIESGFGLIMTANLKSEKYKAKGELEPQEARVFQDSTIRVEYMEAPELYDVALTTLSDTEGNVLLTREETEQTLKHFIDAVHDIQSAYTDSIPAAYGSDQELSTGAKGIGKNKRPSLEKYVIDSGMTARLLQGFRTERMKYGAHLKDFLDAALARTFEGDRVSMEDKRLALFMFAKHGFLQDAEMLGRLKIDVSDGRLDPKIFPGLPVSSVSEAESLRVLDAGTVATLDPYGLRKIRIADADAEFDHAVDPSVKARLAQEARGVERQGEVSLTEAESIMGRELFLGPQAIQETFGFLPNAIPPIPFGKQELEEARGRGQVLILQVDRLSSNAPLTGETLHTQFGTQKDGNKFFYGTDWYKDEDFFKKETPRTGWKLSAPEVLDDSKSKNYFEQTELLAEHVQSLFAGKNIPPAYQEALNEWEHEKGTIAPLMDDQGWQKAAEKLSLLKLNVLTRDTFIERMYLMKLLNQTQGKNILSGTYTWTRSRASGGDLAGVGGFVADGAHVYRYDPHSRSSNLGVSFSRHA
jgi:MoxR-like ATPase